MIGKARPSLKLEEASVAKAINYWIRGIDREIGNNPDLVVLPEACDMLAGLKGADKALFSGKALAVVRSLRGEPGTATLSVSSAYASVKTNITVK